MCLNALFQFPWQHPAFHGIQQYRQNITPDLFRSQAQIRFFLARIFFILVNVLFALPILVLISMDWSISSWNHVPRYKNLSTLFLHWLIRKQINNKLTSTNKFQELYSSTVWMKDPKYGNNTHTMYSVNEYGFL